MFVDAGEMNLEIGIFKKKKKYFKYLNISILPENTMCTTTLSESNLFAGWCDIH